MRHFACGLVVVVACALGLSSVGRGDEASDRFEAAKRRLEEKQKAAASHPAPSATTAPASQPAAGKRSAKVVFVVSTRGGMITQLPKAKVQVTKSIQSLRPDQSFAVIAAGNQEAKTPHKSLILATEANKKRAIEFVEKMEAGGTDGLYEGILAAAKLQPDVVWLVCNGEINDRQAFIGAVRKFSGPNGFRVNTAFGYFPHDDHEEEAAFLEEIAAVSGGVCLDEDGKPRKLKPATPAPPEAPKVDAPPLVE